jgi:hypothetical protein
MRKPLSVVALIGAALLLMPMAPIHAGQPSRFIEITKVVDGDGPSGPYTVEVDCDVNGVTEVDVDDGDTEIVAVQNQTSDSCSVTETGDNGADDVGYDCTPGSLGDEAAECFADNVVRWDGDLTGDAEIVITNTFDPEPTTTTGAPTTTTVAVAAPIAPAVEAVPTFTG